MGVMALLLAGLSAFLYGIADFSGGFAARKSKVLSVLILSQCIGLLVTITAVTTVWCSGVPPLKDMFWGLLAGVTGSFGLFMLYEGIATSIVAIISPASAVVGAFIPVLFAAVFLGERPSTVSVVGSIICLPAIMLLAREGKFEKSEKGLIKSALTYGLLSGLGFGVFFISLSRCSPGAGLWPLVAAKLASITVTSIALFFSGQSFKIENNGIVSALVAGVSDMGANVLYMLATQSGMLSIVVVVTSLFPAPTVILARIFLKQKIPPVRLVGIILALVGIGLISTH
jgi:drug/metabolite transporter (DMT)-like permease